MKFTEYVEVNPKTNLKKGEYAPFVEMANDEQGAADES